MTLHYQCTTFEEEVEKPEILISAYWLSFAVCHVRWTAIVLLLVELVIRLHLILVIV
jgi:hypothetical protein